MNICDDYDDCAVILNSDMYNCISYHSNRWHASTAPENVILDPHKKPVIVGMIPSSLVGKHDHHPCFSQ